MMGSKSRPGWLMPIIIIISAIAASIFVFGNIQSPIRFVVVFWFLVVCPGMTFIALLDIDDKFTTWTLAVALSLALDTAVSLIVLYTNRWSAELIVGILVAITLSGVALRFWRTRQLSVIYDSTAG